jgi:Asp-tRNA(Asn)/Glu-tRNA(Gln) amidotransferase A subunit family amidase
MEKKMNTNMDNKQSEYDLESVELPYLSGFPLKLVVALLESPLRGLLLPTLFKNAGITHFRQQNLSGPPTLNPIHFAGTLTQEEIRIPIDQFPQPTEHGSGFHYTTVHEYARAYRDGSNTPEEIAQKVLEAIETSEQTDPPLRAFIAVDQEDVLKQAKASYERFQNGNPLSLLDGVPVAIKDEVDMVAYPTTVGTSFLGSSPAKQDATVVARLRAAGALLIGKANMHEIGIGVTGLNPHHGTPRNPYNPAHFTGGSSSGPAASVAAGFCPVAIGADGGGSIRIPSSFCGLVGLKSTFGRVSEFGATPLTWSMGHLGPLAATATDAALVYAVIAGSDPKDANTLHQPTPTLEGWEHTDLDGLKLGVYWPWFRHAAQNVVSVCEALLDKLEQKGARVREISIPNLEAGRIAHIITIAAEMNQALDHVYQEHHKEYGLDVRTNLALARQFTSSDYIKSQQVRTQMIEAFQTAFKNVDAILTPTTAIPAPAIPEDTLPDGDSDLTTLIEILRFTTYANLTGLPAISFPAGYNQTGLPIGLQAIGRPWEEATLLRLALAAEQVVERKPPQVFYRLLSS